MKTHTVSKTWRPRARRSWQAPSGAFRPSLRITGRLLESIGLTAGQPVTITRDGDSLTIRPTL